jgi:hypothetical protein
MHVRLRREVLRQAFMKTNLTNLKGTAVCSIALFLAGSTLALAQDQPAAPPPAADQQSGATNGAWRRVGDPPPSAPAEANQPSNMDPNQRSTMDPNYGGPSQYPSQASGPAYNARPIPAKLTIKPGTFVTVRLNQALSSDRNQPGDAFAATLVKPVVVDGVVVAERGQTVGGRVVETKKAGRVSGVSRLGIQLTDLTLADGAPASIQSQLINRNGSTSVGRDVGAVATTTGVGAAIGAAADWGTGAAIGAGAGAAAGLIGVLLTRGRPTVLYPEQVLTFRIEAPVTVSTENAPQAFRYVSPNDYQRAAYGMQARTGPPARAYYGAPSYYPYAYPYYPYYWGTGFGFYWGPRFYYGRGFYGWHGRRWR